VPGGVLKDIFGSGIQCNGGPPGSVPRSPKVRWLRSNPRVVRADAPPTCEMIWNRAENLDVEETSLRRAADCTAAF
jgi:hypothetical protein